MFSRSRFCLPVACVVVLAALTSAEGVVKSFSDSQGFGDSPIDSFFAVAPNTVQFWGVDDGCSPTKVFHNGNRGDGGTNCLVTSTISVGTRMIRDLNPGPGSSTFGEMVQSGVDTVWHLSLSADDGTGTKGQEFYRLVNSLYAEMVPIDINPGAASSSPAGFIRQNPGGLGNAFFSADDGTHGRELWLSEDPEVAYQNPDNMKWGYTIGMNLATFMVMDINPGAGSSNPSGFSTAATITTNYVVFAADDGTNGRELWETHRDTSVDPHVRPTPTMVKDINVGGSSDPQLLTAVALSSGTTDIKVFFTADDGVHGRELWRTDGTTGNTGLVKDIVVGANGSNPTNLTAGNPLVVGVATGTLFFTVDSDGVNGQELWKSRGALDGSDTVQVKDFGASPTSLTNVDAMNTLFFVVGNDLWKNTLGTTAGTVLVKSFVSPPTSLVSVTTTVGTVTTGALYFVADDGLGSGVELWKADGTSATLVKDIQPGAVSSSPTNLLAIGSTLYFSADDGTHGRELWRSDATSGAVLVKDINPGAASSNPANLHYFDGTCVFTADDGTHGRELWQSDGFADPAYNGMSYKWDLSALIQSKGDPSMVEAAATNNHPITIYSYYDFPIQGGDNMVQSEASAQINTYVELTDGTDRAPLAVTNVDCGDGNLPRPSAPLTDGTNHNAIAFGIVAVLDQNPCDTDSRGPGSPGVPFAHVPAIYDGHDWIPVDMAHITPGVPTVPPTGPALAKTPGVDWPGYPSTTTTALYPDLAAVTTPADDPWSVRRFLAERIDIWGDYITVVFAAKQNNTAWAASVPRKYTGFFKSLYWGNSACLQSPYVFYMDSMYLTGGIFTDGHSACCSAQSTTCTTVQSADACPGGRFHEWESCSDTYLCCPTPFADADFDGDVDQIDFASLQACYTGLGGGVHSGCVCFDRDKNNDVALPDFTAFDKCFTGANVPWSQLLTPQCSP